MRTLPKPIHAPVQVFRYCVDGMQSGELKTRMLSVASSIESIGLTYETLAKAAALHTFPAHAKVGGVTSEEMSDLYTSRLARRRAPGRVIYDQLMAAPLNDKCPLCGVGVASTLDHHLPKAYFPALAVNPDNLIPACKDCNKAKLDVHPTKAEEQTLHPYFDTFFAQDRWLYAQVVETTPVALRFLVRPPSHWQTVWAERVRHHFNVVKPQRSYASNAGQEVVNIRHYLDTVFKHEGKVGVRNNLSLRAASAEKAEPNSWQTATYWALSENDWFCEGGFARK